jgi:hypothetical protein
MRSFVRCWFLVCALLGAAASAQAQSPSSYPDRPGSASVNDLGHKP